jgi:hypothetical protein
MLEKIEQKKIVIVYSINYELIKANESNWKTKKQKKKNCENVKRFCFVTFVLICSIHI